MDNLKADSVSLQANDLGYSIRRYYVDAFYTRSIRLFQPGMRLLDIGGKKKNKRGAFNVENYQLQVEYVNIGPETEPDYLCDAAAIPVPDNSYDGVICSEVLEHVRDPKAVITEMYRLLKKGGQALITVPFMVHFHPDPCDYGRYTESYWYAVAEETGFKVTHFEYHGTIYALMANLVKLWVNEQLKNKKIFKVKRLIAAWIAPFLVRFLMVLESKNKMQDNVVYKGSTTGFGMVFEK